MATTKISSTKEAVEQMWYELGRLVGSNSIIGVGLHTQSVQADVKENIDEWSRKYVIEQSVAKEEYPLKLYLHKMLAGIGWEVDETIAEKNQTKIAENLMEMSMLLSYHAEKEGFETEDQEECFLVEDFKNHAEKWAGEFEAVYSGEEDYIDALEKFFFKKMEGIGWKCSGYNASTDDTESADEPESPSDSESTDHHEPEWGGWVKLSAEEALEMRDSAVYLLYDDGTEAEAENRDVIEAHAENGGEFAVEKDAYYAWKSIFPHPAINENRHYMIRQKNGVTMPACYGELPGLDKSYGFYHPEFGSYHNYMDIIPQSWRRFSEEEESRADEIFSVDCLLKEEKQVVSEETLKAVLFQEAKIAQNRFKMHPLDNTVVTIWGTLKTIIEKASLMEEYQKFLKN